ncbi:MAG: phosphoenolpyruvate carboxylase [Microgenomates group bacterium]
MASQHPDNAGIPFWHNDTFVGRQDEIKELYVMFSDLGVGECMLDWEGKYVAEDHMEQLYTSYSDFFAKNPLGDKKFLTYRLPNPKVETEFRLGRALMGILSSSVLSNQFNLTKPPLFEVILPMTETAEEMIAVQDAFSEMSNLKSPLLRFQDATLKHIQLIPLFEQAETISISAKILEDYVKLHQERFGFKPDYIRPFIARSDPALNSGLVPTLLAAKIALSDYEKFENETGINLYPIIGTGSLPFRGSLRPDVVEDFASEYKGVSTALIQSAFRYDWDTKTVSDGIRKLEELLPKESARLIDSADLSGLKSISSVFELNYRGVVETIAPLVNAVARFVPTRRERLQHVGLFGYSRGVSGVVLPRAIGFTAAQYSIGVPPELIGTGRGLSEAKKSGKLDLIENTYINLKKDLIHAGKFLNKENLRRLGIISSGWERVLKDVSLIEEYLDQPLGPETDKEQEHFDIVRKIYNRLSSGDNEIGDLMQRAAEKRNSIG